MAGRAYVESRPRPALAGVTLREWQRPASGGRELLILPDGCADILWSSEGGLLVVGPDLGPARHYQAPGVSFTGLRLLPGAAGAVLGHEVDELREQLVPLSTLWGSGVERVAERLGETPSLTEQRAILAELVQRRIDSVAVDREIVATARALATSREPVSHLAERAGLGDRQLQRRFVRQVGYGPKTFQRIMRFRRAVAIYRASANAAQDGATGTRSTTAAPGAAGAPSLAELAVAAGYSDQAHFTRECRRLTGLTPGGFLAWLRPDDPALVRSAIDDGVTG